MPMRLTWDSFLVTVPLTLCLSNFHMEWGCINGHTKKEEKISVFYKNQSEDFDVLFYPNLLLDSTSHRMVGSVPN